MAGTTTIKATSQDGSGVVGEFELEVGKAVNPIVSINITSATGSPTVVVGDTLKLNASINPSNATKTDLVWSSSNKDVATMNQDGTVNPKKAGKTIITAASQDGSGINGTIEITVYDSDTAAINSAKAELTALLNQYAAKNPNTSSLTTAYATSIPVVEDPEDINSLPTGSKYVNKNDVAALNKAINDAYVVLNTSNDVTAIKNAITNFNNIVNGTNGTPGLVKIKTA